MNLKHVGTVGVVIVAFILCATAINYGTQQLASGGAVTIVQGGNIAQVTAAGAQKVDGSAVTQPISGTITANAGSGTLAVSGPLTDAQLRASAVPVSGSFSMGALVTGTANVGIIRSVPSSCTQATPFASTTVGVATGAGTSVTSTTTCLTLAYVNNTTNSPVTFRLQDKTGTPIIWFGGNADFTLMANSSVRIPLEGVTFANGITAIAGTAAALNLQILGLQ